jgi:hypothetical protein
VRALVLGGVIVAAAIGLMLQGLPGFPVLMLGLVTVLGSLMTDDLFQRAKAAH